MAQTYQEKHHEEKVNYWRPILTGWQESGLTATNYCIEHQLNLHQFKYWQYQLFPETKHKYQWEKPNEISFTPVVVASKSLMPVTTIDLQTPNGYYLKIAADFDKEVLSKLLKLLREAL